MNAIAEREVRAHELAEHRRQVIADQIMACLHGQTEHVYMAWSLQTIPYAQCRQGLIEGIEDALITRLGPDFVAQLLSALTVEGNRPELIKTYYNIIGDLADVTHNCMTEAELEALKC